MPVRSASGKRVHAVSSCNMHMAARKRTRVYGHIKSASKVVIAPNDVDCTATGAAGGGADPDTTAVAPRHGPTGLPSLHSNTAAVARDRRRDIWSLWLPGAPLRSVLLGTTLWGCCNMFVCACDMPDAGTLAGSAWHIACHRMYTLRQDAPCKRGSSQFVCCLSGCSSRPAIGINSTLTSSLRGISCKLVDHFVHFMLD